MLCSGAEVVFVDLSRLTTSPRIRSALDALETMNDIFFIALISRDVSSKNWAFLRLFLVLVVVVVGERVHACLFLYTNSMARTNLSISKR